MELEVAEAESTLFRGGSEEREYVNAAIHVNTLYTRMMMAAYGMSIILCTGLTLLATQEQEVYHLLFIMPDRWREGSCEVR